MADNPVFADDEDILRINKDDLRYDTPGTSRIEENLGTEQPEVKLKQMQDSRLLRERIIDLYRYLNVDSANVDLVNTKLFKYKESERRREWVEL